MRDPFKQCANLANVNYDSGMDMVYCCYFCFLCNHHPAPGRTALYNPSRSGCLTPSTWRSYYHYPEFSSPQKTKKKRKKKKKWFSVCFLSAFDGNVGHLDLIWLACSLDMYSKPAKFPGVCGSMPKYCQYKDDYRCLGESKLGWLPDISLNTLSKDLMPNRDMRRDAMTDSKIASIQV